MEMPEEATPELKKNYALFAKRRGVMAATAREFIVDNSVTQLICEPDPIDPEKPRSYLVCMSPSLGWIVLKCLIGGISLV